MVIILTSSASAGVRIKIDKIWKIGKKYSNFYCFAKWEERIRKGI